MARASSYFFNGTDSSIQTLHRRITPSDTQYDEQEARWNLLADYIKPKLTESSGYSMKSWLQGSYKFGTQIRPVHADDEFDIDLGIYYCWVGNTNAGDYSPKDLMEMVQRSLEEYSKSEEDVIGIVNPPKTRCCRIRFKGKFHIDVPSYHLDDARDSRRLATFKNTWETSDPKSLYKWFTSELGDYTRARARRFVRYMKTWAALKFSEEKNRPASVLITVLVAQAVKKLGDKLPGPEDEALQAILKLMNENISTSQQVINPVDSNENLASRMDGSQWNSFAGLLNEFYNISIEANEADNELSACTLWSSVFEHLFPLPDTQAISKMTSQLPAVRTLPEVQVNAVSKDNRNLQFSGINKIGPIPKNCDITFQVTNSGNMPFGTQYYWMVRNEGDEAEDINDLGHKAGQGIVATERSAYNGSHKMDCTAVASGQIIGVRRIPVHISSIPTPKRNPPKPAWTRIRGSR